MSVLDTKVMLPFFHVHKVPFGGRDSNSTCHPLGKREMGTFGGRKSISSGESQEVEGKDQG